MNEIQEELHRLEQELISHIRDFDAVEKLVNCDDERCRHRANIVDLYGRRLQLLKLLGNDDSSARLLHDVLLGKESIEKLAEQVPAFGPVDLLVGWWLLNQIAGGLQKRKEEEDLTKRFFDAYEPIRNSVEDRLRKTSLVLRDGNHLYVFFSKYFTDHLKKLGFNLKDLRLLDLNFDETDDRYLWYVGSLNGRKLPGYFVRKLLDFSRFLDWESVEKGLTSRALRHVLS